jgi:hypothetical protein
MARYRSPVPPPVPTGDDQEARPVGQPQLTPEPLVAQRVRPRLWTLGWFLTGPLPMAALAFSARYTVTHTGHRPPLDGPLAIGLLAVCVAAVCVRPRWPLPALLVVAAAATLHAASGFTTAPLALAALWLGGVTVVRRSGAWHAVAGLLAVFVAYVMIDHLYGVASTGLDGAAIFTASAGIAGAIARRIHGSPEVP